MFICRNRFDGEVPLIWLVVQWCEENIMRTCVGVCLKKRESVRTHTVSKYRCVCVCVCVFVCVCARVCC